MTISIFSKGKEYISASRAAEVTGYSGDYIGQLCRAGKIRGTLITRTWYVDLTSVMEHKEGRKLGKPKLSRELETKTNELWKEKGESSPQKQVVEIPQNSFVNLFHYSADDRNLLPELTNRNGLQESSISNSFLREFSIVIACAVLVVLGASIFIVKGITHEQQFSLDREAVGANSEINVSHPSMWAYAASFINTAPVREVASEGLRSIKETLGMENEDQDWSGVGLSREEIKAILVGNTSELPIQDQAIVEVDLEAETKLRATSTDPFGLYNQP